MESNAIRVCVYCFEIFVKCYYSYRCLLDKLKQTSEHWPWEKMPTYAMGSGYLIAGSAIHPLLAAAQVTPFPQPNGAFEDLYATSLCAEIANVAFRSYFDR